jgi:hypothetical protein
MQRGEREDATGLWWLNEFMKHCTSGIWSVQSQVGALSFTCLTRFETPCHW